jgi:hypothetical protein
LNAIWQGCEQEQARTGKKDQIESDDHIQATAFSLPVHTKPANLSWLVGQEKPQFAILRRADETRKCCNTFRMHMPAGFECFHDRQGEGALPNLMSLTIDVSYRIAAENNPPPKHNVYGICSTWNIPANCSTWNNLLNRE